MTSRQRGAMNYTSKDTRRRQMADIGLTESTLSAHRLRWIAAMRSCAGRTVLHHPAPRPDVKTMHDEAIFNDAG
jgi:hypothetical protein